jgi:hypothetical protein
MVLCRLSVLDIYKLELPDLPLRELGIIVIYVPTKATSYSLETLFVSKLSPRRKNVLVLTLLLQYIPSCYSDW